MIPFIRYASILCSKIAAIRSDGLTLCQYQYSSLFVLHLLERSELANSLIHRHVFIMPSGSAYPHGPRPPPRIYLT